MRQACCWCYNSWTWYLAKTEILWHNYKHWWPWQKIHIVYCYKTRRQSPGHIPSGTTRSHSSQRTFQKNAASFIWTYFPEEHGLSYLNVLSSRKLPQLFERTSQKNMASITWTYFPEQHGLTHMNVLSRRTRPHSPERTFQTNTASLTWTYFP
jgi:hypothetical protein